MIDKNGKLFGKINIIDLIVTSDNCVAITSFGHKIIIEIWYF